MRRMFHARPQLESMEAKTLLSGVAAAIAALPIHAEVSSTADAKLTLGGTAHGGFIAPPDLDLAGLYRGRRRGPDPDRQGGCHRDARRGLGPFERPAERHAAPGHEQGEPDARDPQVGLIPAGLPAPTSKGEIVDTYVITGGTGAYKGDTGSGVVEFTFTPKASAGAYQVGRVAITFKTLPTTPSPA